MIMEHFLVDFDLCSSFLKRVLTWLISMACFFYFFQVDHTEISRSMASSTKQTVPVIKNVDMTGRETISLEAVYSICQFLRRIEFCVIRGNAKLLHGSGG